MEKVSNYWLKSGAITLIERVGTLVIGVFTFVLLARNLTKSEYGEWMLYLSVCGFVEVLRRGLLKVPLIKTTNEETTYSTSQIQGTNLFLNVILGFSMAFFLFLFRDLIAKVWGGSHLDLLFEVYFWGFLVHTLYAHSDFIQAAKLRFMGSALSSLTEKGVLLTGIVLMAYQPELVSQCNRLLLLAYLHLLGVFLGFLVNLIFIHDLIFKLAKPMKMLIMNQLNYGKYTLGTNMGAILLRNIDTWMIGIMLNPAAVAIYNVAIRLSNLFETPTMALAQIMLPKAVQNIKKEGKPAFKRMYESSVAVVLLFSIPLILVISIFAPQLVLLLAGEGYSEAVDVLRISIALGLVIPFSKQMGIMLDADGKANVNMRFVFRNALINTLLNGLAIYYFGVIGAAAATLCSFMLSSILEQRYLKKEYEVSLRGVFKQLREWTIEAPKLLFRRLR